MMQLDLSMLRAARRPAVTAAFALTLAGCVSFGAKPPPYLLALTADTPVAAGAGVSGSADAAIVVLVPDIPQKLATPRVPVQAADTEIAYVQQAQWVDTPHRLFRALLSETIAARTGRLVLDEGQTLAAPGTRLGGQLADFGIDATAGDAVVTYDAALVVGDAVRTRRFQARVPVGAIEPRSVGVALNAAANRVAADVAAWLAG